MIHPRHFHELSARVLLPRLGHRDELPGVMRRDLHVELALNDEHRLVDVLHHLPGVEGQQAVEPRRIGGAPHLIGHAVPAAALQDRGVNLFLQGHFRGALGRVHFHQLQLMALLLQDEIRAGRPRPGNEHHGLHPILA